MSTDLPGNRADVTLREVDALSDLDNATVRIADVAANLVVLAHLSGWPTLAWFSGGISEKPPNAPKVGQPLMPLKPTPSSD